MNPYDRFAPRNLKPLTAPKRAPVPPPPPPVDEDMDPDTGEILGWTPPDDLPEFLLDDPPTEAEEDPDPELPFGPEFDFDQPEGPEEYEEEPESYEPSMEERLQDTPTFETEDKAWVLDSITAMLGRDPLDILAKMEPLQKERAEYAAAVARDEHRRKVVLAEVELDLRREYAGKRVDDDGRKITEAYYDVQARASEKYREFLDAAAERHRRYAELDAEYWRMKSLFDYVMKAVDWARSEAYTVSRAG